MGYVVRQLENDFNLFKCFEAGTNHCVISPACKLKHVLHEALRAFHAVLDQYTLRDLIINERELRIFMGLNS